MIIQIAKPEDIPQLVRIGRQIHPSTGYSIFKYDDAKTTESFNTLITGDPTKGIVLVARRNGEIVGGVGATVTQTLFSTESMATEWFWWTRDGESKRTLLSLLSAYEYWAQHVAKCKAILIGRVQFKDNDNTRFAKRGYRICEESFLKELK